jgi:hypothetical protein
MNKLSVQDLKFIDNYLKKSEIFYDDIRMELTDHIATAIEDKMETENINFYDAFKRYMILNKKELLKKFSGSGYKSFEPVKSFGLLLIKPISLLLGIVFIMSFYFFNDLFDKEYFVSNFQIYWLICLFIFGMLHLVYFNFIKKKRFFAVEQSFFVLSVIYYVFIPFSNPFNVTNFNLIFLIDISILFFSFVYIFFYYTRIKMYYNNKHIWNQK